MSPQKSKQLLLVDDDDSIRWVLNELLHDLGHHVTQAISAEEAIELLSKCNFDLVISDVRMSGKSGMELLDLCKENHPDMPIIIMTAHSDLDSAVNAYLKGAYEYLPKPFDLDEVSSIIDKALAPLDSTASNSQQTKEQNKFSIIGESAAMQDLYRAIGRL